MAAEATTEVEKTSVLDELMKDDDTTEEPVSEETEEEITPDHELKLAPEEDDDNSEETDEDSETDEQDGKRSKPDDDEEKEVNLEDENELELAKIPKRQEIKAAYPDIFKKFPQLEHALYREQAFTEVFPTVNDAKEAKESIAEYSNFQSELMSGNIDGVLKSVKAADPKAFDKIANSIIDSLVRVDPNSHLPTTRKITKGVLYQINQLAKMNLKKDPNNKNAQQLEIASELIHDAIFNTVDVSLDQEQQVQQREDPERAKFDAERKKFEETRMTAAVNGVRGKVTNTLTKAVTNGIDEKGILPPYVKSTVIKDVMSELDRQLGSDKAFRSIVDKLYLKASNDGYSDASLNNIQTALINKAKSILPAIMKAKKGEALKGLGTTKKKEEPKRELSRTTQSDRTAPKEKLTLNRRDNDRLTPRPGESKLDFLMRD